MDPASIRTYEDFRDLPLIDKRSYLLANQDDLERLCVGGTLEASHTIARSSGFTGDPLYWPRAQRQDEMAKRSAEVMYVDFWDMDRVPSLLVICFDLGMWIAGELSAHASREIAMKGYPITVTTPGSNLVDALGVVQRLGHRFGQVALMGYPPFLKQLMDLGDREGVDWKSLNVVLLPSGEGFSESWRTHMLDRIGKPDDLRAVVGMFGMSEGAVVGYETPLSVFTRRRAEADAELRRDLLGTDSNCYAMVQYNPMGSFLEAIEGEMVLTTGGKLPLVRYNSREQGGLLEAPRVLEILASHGYGPEQMREAGVDTGAMWSIPFFFSFGRQDCVSVDGANIYVEGLEPALLKSGMDGIRDWRIAVRESGDHGLKFVVLVEMGPELAGAGPGAIESKRLHYQETFRDELIAGNPDYASAHRNNPESMEPEIVLYGPGEGPFSGAATIKKRHVHKGAL